MRLAVSDYDGTLCMGKKVADEVLEAVREWRGRGNLFGIATGRDLGMITYETERWGLEFDFLACCNGAVLYDADLSVLQSLDIREDLIGQVLEHESARTSLIYAVCGDQRLYFCELKPVGWFKNLKMPYVAVSREEALKLKRAQQICLAYDSEEESANHTAALNRAFGADLQAFQNQAHIDVIRAEASKAKGIEDILRIKGWRPEKVLSIGDGENDIPMLKRFGGFSVPGASDRVKGEAAKVYASVGEMLREFM